MEKANNTYGEIEDTSNCTMEEANNTFVEIFGEIEEIIDEVEHNFKEMKKFDVLVNPPYDHHFFKYDKNSKNMEAAFRIRIETEWLLLQEKLPSSILVRSYAKRIDLMRIVLVGPPNTPYVHGLFFFDLLFPRNYPNCPPRLHYHSYDLNLNQYLDTKGKVSLSLLECGNFLTNWYSGVQGKWNPQESNILQVLQAIQTSILSANPSSGERLRVSHNSEWLKYKKAFTLTCKGMLSMLRGPPMDFEDFVAGHFRTRAHYILLNYRKLMDDSDFMIQLYHELYTAFEENGTYCKHHPWIGPPRVNLHTEEKTNSKGFKDVATILSN